MSMQLASEMRTGHTKSERRQLRQKGKVPGIVYGKKTGSVPLSVDEKEIKEALRKHRHGILDLNVPSLGTFPVIIHEVQRDSLNGQLQHIDFHQVNMDEPVKTVVPLHFVGEPLGVGTGGMLQIQLHEVEVRCLPNQIPEAIQVDIGGLDIGDIVLVEQLSLAAGVELKSSPQDVVATVLASRKEAVELEEAAEQAGVKANNDATAASAATS